MTSLIGLIEGNAIFKLVDTWLFQALVLWYLFMLVM